MLVGTDSYKIIHLIDPVQVIAQDLSKMIRERPILELQSSSSNQDYVLSGLM